MCFKGAAPRLDSHARQRASGSFFLPSNLPPEEQHTWFRGSVVTQAGALGRLPLPSFRPQIPVTPGPLSPACQGDVGMRKSHQGLHHMKPWGFFLVREGNESPFQC